MRILALCLLLSGCGVRLLDCPPSASDGMARAVTYFPSASLDFLDVRCEVDMPPEVPCLTWAHGSPVAHAVYEVDYDLAARCIVHEAHHSALYHQGNSCQSHDAACGWDKVTIEIASEGLPL